jgi:hypothetical protein
MQRWAIDRMVWSTDANLRGDGAKPADLCVADHAAAAEIGEIAKLGIFDRGVAQDLTATADLRLPQPDRRLDHGFEVGQSAGGPQHTMRASRRQA